MSTWKIRVNGKPMEVEVEETITGHYNVKVNGNEHKVHVDEADWGLSISPVGMEAGAQVPAEKISRVVIRSGRRGAGATDAATALRPTKPAGPPGTPAAMPKLPPASPPPPVAMGANTVVSPMPGKIIKVLVNVGDQVNAGDGICVLESMKMENTVPTPIAGTIKALHVKVGDNPNTGMPLADIE